MIRLLTYELVWQSGYSCNENLFTKLPCSPCWLWSKCDFNHKCMTDIDASSVAAAVVRQADRTGSPLSVETDLLHPSVETDLLHPSVETDVLHPSVETDLLESPGTKP